MDKGLILIGGGEHATAVADAIGDATEVYRLIGFVDPRPPSSDGRARDLRYLGDEEALESYREAALVLAFGSLASWKGRPKAVHRLALAGWSWATVVHRASWISRSAEIGPGTVVMPGAIVQARARIGSHCVVNTGAIVEHDVSLGDNVHLAPGATVGGAAVVGSGAYVGLGASIRDHVIVGEEALVGMAAAVVADVPRGARVMGIPAR
jgi:acetyltransferase EpsM